MISGDAQQLPRSAGAVLPIAHQTRREGRQHLLGDLYTKSNYQDFQRYRRSGHRDRGGRPGDAAVADRSLQAVDHRRSAARLGRAGQKIAAANAQSLERARIEATYAWDASPISTRASVGRDVGRGQEQGLGAGRAAAAAGSGTSTSSIGRSAAAGRRQSAPGCRPLSARRWRTRSTAGCASACRPTAT